jgi:MFS family permease
MPDLPVRNPKRLIPLIMLITGMGVLAFSVITPVLPELAEELGVSRGAIGLVQGAVALPGIVLAPYIGYLADKHGRRQVIRGSLVVFGLAGLAAFFVRSFWPLVALRFVQGFGTSGLLSLGVVVVGDLFDGNERRWAMGLNLAGLTLTTTFAPILGGLLAEGGAFRPFLVFSLAIPVWFLARWLPGRSGFGSPAPPFRHLRAAFAELRRRGRLTDFLGVLPVSFITLGAFVGLVLTVTPLFLDRLFALSVSERGLVMAIGSAASSTASVLSGRIGARFSPARVLTTSFGLLVLGLVVIGSAPSLWLVGLGLAITGSGSGSIFPLLQDFSASAGPREYRGALVGSWVSANRLGQTLGPIVATGVADAVGERPAYFLGAGIVLTVLASWRPLRRGAHRRVQGSSSRSS